MLKIAKLLLLSFVIVTGTVLLCYAVEDSGCVNCHRGQDGELRLPVTLWEGSVHKQAGVSCHDCHGGNSKIMDDTDKSMFDVAGFLGTPDKKKVPELCAKCHSDIGRMRRYNLRTDQFELYKSSVHGKKLYGEGDVNVAVCSSCHGAHDIKKVNDPNSHIYHTNVPDTCGK